MILNDLASKYNTDKRLDIGQNIYHGYTVKYESLFSSIRTNKMNVLEIGVREGSSHKMWEEYFENSIIYGVDNLSDPMITDEMKQQYIESLETDRIKIFIGDQSDKDFMLSINKDLFDIIIDDGSHRSWHQQKTLNFMFDKLKSGGIYIIEDLGCCYGRDFREHDDILSSTLHWLEHLRNGGTISYYVEDVQKLLSEIDSIELCGELGIIRKRQMFI